MLSLLRRLLICFFGTLHFSANESDEVSDQDRVELQEEVTKDKEQGVETVNPSRTLLVDRHLSQGHIPREDLPIRSFSAPFVLLHSS